MPRPFQIAAVVVPLLAMAAMAVLSDGVLMDDDLTHYTMARWSWSHPMYLADDWGRPGFTVPYALVANVGPPGTGFLLCRLMTVGIVALAAWLAWRTAVEVVGEGRAWVAPAALVTMPMYFQLGYTTLTETVCSLYAIAGTWLLLRDRVYLAAAAFSLVPVTRHEGVLLLPAAAVLLAWRGAWGAIPLLLAGELAWNVAKPLLGYPWNELPIYRFAVKGEPGHLGAGGPLHYVAGSTRAFGPAQAALGVVGAVVLLVSLTRTGRIRTFAALRSGVWGLPYSGARGAAILCAVGTLGMLLVQTYLYMVNTHESGGYARFLLPAAPWAAVCVAAAVGFTLDARRGGRRAVAAAVIAFASLAMLGLWWSGWSLWWGLAPALIPVAAVPLLRPTAIRPFLIALALLAAGTWLAAVRPHRLLPHQRLVIETAERVRRDHPDHAVVADNPWADYAVDARRHPYFWAANDWHRATDGGLIYLWDRDHSSVNLPLDELRQHPHRELPAPPGGYLRVFERLPDE